jgi:hypothetical protein
MTPLDQQPARIRKMVALVITIGVAAVLLLLLVIEYSNKKNAPAANESGSRLKNFYTTILSNGQSALEGK